MELLFSKGGEDLSKQYYAVYKVLETGEKVGVTTCLQDNPANTVLGLFPGNPTRHELLMPPENYFVRFKNGYMVELCTLLQPNGANRVNRSLVDRNDPEASALIRYVQQDWQRDALTELFIVDPVVRRHMLLFRELWDKSANILDYGKIKIAK